MKENLSLLQIVKYEIAASWWAQYISNDWLQTHVAAYYVRKSKRKFARYKKHVEFNAAQNNNLCTD